jgi:RNA polymerase sigma-70 factor, ECF subfamily
MNLLIPANDGLIISHSLKQMSDEWLVSAAKDGKANAFVELRDRHSRKILRTTYRITRNWEHAEDALPDSFLKAFIHLKNLEGRSSFSSWVTRIAINTSLMIMRKKRANRELSIDAGDNDCESHDSWEPHDLGEDPERRYARHERAELVRGAIRRLRPSLRTVVELQQAQAYSSHQIADSLGISLAAVKSRLARARLSMRTLLHDNNLKSNQGLRAAYEDTPAGAHDAPSLLSGFRGQLNPTGHQRREPIRSRRTTQCQLEVTLIRNTRSQTESVRSCSLMARGRRRQAAPSSS